MWRFVFTIILSSYLNQVSSAQSLDLATVDAATQQRFGCLFEGSVTIGASVSSGYLGITPASEIVSKAFGKPLLENLAHNGQKGITSVSELRNYLKKHPKDKPVTIIFAVDAFFWDATKLNVATTCDQSLEALNSLFTFAEEKGIWLIIGNVPIKKITSKACAEKLNASINEKCAKYSHCLLRDAYTFDKELQSSGSFTYKGVTYSKWKFPRINEGLVVDGLHYTDLAQKIFADRIISTLKSTDYSCPGKTQQQPPQGRGKEIKSQNSPR